MVSAQKVQTNVEDLKEQLATTLKRAPHSDEAKKEVKKLRRDIKGLRNIKKAIAADAKRKRVRSA